MRERIEAAVQKKVEGQEITMAEAPEGGAQVIDLMEALRASLEKKGAARRRSRSEAESAQAAEARPAPSRGRAARPRRNSAIDEHGSPAMHQYGVRDVEKLLRLPRSTIRTLIEAGFVSPARGPRNAWRFSFQDLIVLRTAQALAAAKVPRGASRAR